MGFYNKQKRQRCPNLNFYGSFVIQIFIGSPLIIFWKGSLWAVHMNFYTKSGVCSSKKYLSYCNRYKRGHLYNIVQTFELQTKKFLYNFSNLGKFLKLRKNNEMAITRPFFEVQTPDFAWKFLLTGCWDLSKVQWMYA